MSTNEHREVVALLGTEDDERDFTELNTVFFSPAFLCQPPEGWSVHWLESVGDGWKTLVKLDKPRRVWALTDHRDFSTGYFEGRWPD